MPQIVYADRHETILHEHPIQSSPARNHVLLGSWLRVGVDQGDWLHVGPRPNRGDGVG